MENHRNRFRFLAFRGNINNNNRDDNNNNNEVDDEEEQDEDHDLPNAMIMAAPPPVVVARRPPADEDDEDDENLPIAVELPRHRGGGGRPGQRWVRPATTAAMVVVDESAASANILWGMLQEGVHCKDDLLSDGGCEVIVQRCRQYPQEVNFVCRHSGRTLLHEAALRCCCIHVVRALGQQAEVEAFAFDRFANTPLHLLFTGIACRQLSPERVNPLVDEFLQTSQAMMACAQNLEGYTPLHVACTGPETMVPSSTIVRLLEASTSCASKQSRRGEFPLHLHCQRRNASALVTQLLMDAHPAALRVMDSSDLGYTPLHYACAKLNTKLILLLIQADDFALRLRSPTGETPLHVFCRQKPATEEHLQAFKAMLELAPEVTTWRDTRRGNTPLHSLCQSPTVPVAIIEAVLAAASKDVVHVANPQLLLPLHVACETGVDAAVVNLLLQADPNTARDLTRKKDTALHLACSANQSVETVQLLLKHYPEATSKANDYGYLPIHGSVRSYQPHRAIVAALTEASPKSLIFATNGGESAIHLLSNNNSASTTLLNDMSRALKQISPESPMTSPVLVSKVGNTPLHLACFRGAQKEQIESLAIANPEWLAAPNSAGFTPLQILCKSGRVDADLITLFARLGGPDIFSMADDTGNTPLHSAIRAETDLQALQALIRACPRVLHAKTIYGDTPLHLACLRHVSAEVVHEVALSSCQGLEVSLANCDQLISPILLQNTAGQTPVTIAMEEYLKEPCGLQKELVGSKKRAFDVLATLSKMLHYGPTTAEEHEGQNLVLACVSLHRKNVRLDPTFVRRAILAAPEQVSETDEHGNYPLHLEAGIPIEKMALLDGARPGCCRGGTCTQRSGVLRLLLDIFPQAARHRNHHGDFPLALMIQNGRRWDSTFSLVLRTHPQAFHWVEGVTQVFVPRILARVSRECGKETVLSLLATRPDVILADRSSKTVGEGTNDSGKESP